MASPELSSRLLSLLALPREIHAAILPFLRFFDLYTLRLVNQYFYALIPPPVHAELLIGRDGRFRLPRLLRTELDLVVASLALTDPIYHVFKMTSSVWAPHVCERIPYSGILLPTRSLVRLSWPALLRSRRRMIQADFEIIKKGKASRASKNRKSIIQALYTVI
jgi:hypothetical protein